MIVFTNLGGAQIYAQTCSRRLHPSVFLTLFAPSMPSPMRAIEFRVEIVRRDKPRKPRRSGLLKPSNVPRRISPLRRSCADVRIALSPQFVHPFGIINSTDSAVVRQYFPNRFCQDYNQMEREKVTKQTALSYCVCH